VTNRDARDRLPPALHERIVLGLRDHVRDRSFPCLGARSALSRGGLATAVYAALGSESSSQALARDLGRFGAGDQSASRFVAFAAVFIQAAPVSEIDFEAQLWHQLTVLSSLDASAWAPEVSRRADDPDFAFSFGATAYFVVGLHPESSRRSRRTGWPVLVFNPHDQFRRLRAEERFDSLRQAIRLRDRALQGDINPSLADVGEISEARQYSGRNTEADWQCPFHRRRS
jgi:FPC/CPF motif-containing protein YcgG